MVSLEELLDSTQDYLILAETIIYCVRGSDCDLLKNYQVPTLRRDWNTALHKPLKELLLLFWIFVL